MALRFIAANSLPPTCGDSPPDSSDTRTISRPASWTRSSYLWDSGASAVVSDSFATEVWAPDRSEAADPIGYLHRVLIGRLGFAIGEFWDLEALSEDSLTDTVYEFSSRAPLHIPHGIGSPANALGIK